MALLPSNYLDAVVSIGKEGFTYETLATGFLVGFLVEEKSKEGENLYRIFLVTNRHVFEGLKDTDLRFNLKQGGSKKYNLVLEDAKGIRWKAHINEFIDLAVVPFDVDLLLGDDIKFDFIPEENIAFLNTIKDVGISQGDGIFVLGFPMGLSGEERNYVIVRSGIIARLDDEIISKRHEFFVDATIFPGNSGGPVILRPEAMRLEGTKSVKKSYLIGVVRSYLPYEDEAISKETKKTRIVFVENSGIAGVVPMDFVKEIAQPFIDEENSLYRKKISLGSRNSGDTTLNSPEKR